MSNSQSTDGEPDDDIPEDDLSNGCCVPESEMLVCRDLNLDYPWKGGNQYSRICPECGSRTFTAKSYWEMRVEDPDEQAYIIPQGDDTEPQPYFICPYGDCTGTFYGFPDECPECEREFEWEGLDDEETGGDSGGVDNGENSTSTETED
jgi:RNA polymerase subunit RPABC4/transcription elongation factor Spt4